MVYAFTGSPCDGFTTRFRFVMSIQSGEEKRITDQQTTTHEDGDGRSFSFSTRNFVNNTLDREIRGHAEATDEGLTVELSKPQAAAYRLPDGLFPTSHLGDLIERAGRGETFYETAIYDGSDDADAVLTTTVFVGQPAPAADSDAEKKALGTLGDEPAWPVSIAYFRRDQQGSDGLPLYRVDFRLHPNGVTRTLTMDYGDYTLAGRLVDLTMLDSPASCP